MKELENHNHLKDEVNKSFETLKKLIEESFSSMDKTPESKDKIIKLWENQISQFVLYTFKLGERYENKDIFKAITKTMIFGK